jgi:hypothetical protein
MSGPGNLGFFLSSFYTTAIKTGEATILFPREKPSGEWEYLGGCSGMVS